MIAAHADIFKRFNRLWLEDEGLSAFLVLFILLFFLESLITSTTLSLLTSIFFSLFMLSGVVNMSSHPGIRFFAGFVAISSIGLRWMTYFVSSPQIFFWCNLTSIIFMVLLTMVILNRVFMQEKQVNGHMIRGAIAAYLLFGITWAFIYGLLDQILPHAFNISASGGFHTPGRQEDLVYFSFVTLTTTGYGDITPSHQLSGMFAIAEALIGQLYPATLLARLVSLQGSSRNGNGGSAE